jgi:hypothetical protein
MRQTIKETLADGEFVTGYCLDCEETFEAYSQYVRELEKIDKRIAEITLELAALHEARKDLGTFYPYH